MSNIIKEIEAEQLKETVDQFEVGDTVGSLSNSESLSVAAALSLQYNAFEYLDSLTVTLFDLAVYLNGIADFKLINGCF